MKINAYPNPTADLITVSAINNNYQKVSLAITDVSGRSIGQYNTLAAGSIQLTSGTPIAGYPVQTDGTGHLSFTPPPTGACTVCVWAYATDGTDIYNTNPGYVGIGTSTPQSDITIWGADIVGGNQPNAVAEVDNNQSSYIDNTGHSDDIIHTANYAPNSLIVNRVNTIGQTYPSPPTSTTVTDFVVTSSGYVGIGTATPQSTLDVAGGVAVGTYAGSASAPSNGMIVSGYVGIGTNDPAFNLDVNGNARVTSNSIIGGNATIAGYVKIGDVTTPNSLTYSGADGNYGYSLYVQYGVLAESFKCALKGDATNWSDYVFDKGYKLPNLDQVKKYIDTNHHLPGVPSADDVVCDGIDMAKMDATLLKKIEELTLYVLDLKKDNDAMKAQISNLKK
jgi:hypothetical protein